MTTLTATTDNQAKPSYAKRGNFSSVFNRTILAGAVFVGTMFGTARPAHAGSKDSLKQAGNVIVDNVIGGFENRINGAFNKAMCERTGGIWVESSSSSSRYGTNGKTMRSSASGRVSGKCLKGTDKERYLSKMLRGKISEYREIVQLRAEGMYQNAVIYAGNDRALQSAARSIKTISRRYEASMRKVSNAQELDNDIIRFLVAADKFDVTIEESEGVDMRKAIVDLTKDLTGIAISTKPLLVPQGRR